MKQILLDLDRTFYTHRDLMEKGGEGQKKLFNVLAVYAGKVNPGVGYCQGMAFVAAVMLMVMPEEEASNNNLLIFRRLLFSFGVLLIVWA
jgi:hypothetical protein